MGADDDKPGDKARGAPPGGAPPTSALGPPGSGSRANSRDGVVHDKRGNAVWKWAVDTGKHAIDSTSRLLKRLEVPGLKLEDDHAPRVKPGAQPGEGGAPPSVARSSRGPAGPPSRTAGHDPYGRSARSGKPFAPPPAAVKKPVTAPPPRRSWWKRLFRRR